MSPSKPTDSSWLGVASRVGAAVLGGYSLTYGCTACLTLLLPMPKSEAILTAAMLSFLVYTATILWAFVASTAAKAWIGLLLPAVVCAAISLPWTSALGD